MNRMIERILDFSDWGEIEKLGNHIFWEGMKILVPENLYWLMRDDVLISDHLEDLCVEGETLWYLSDDVGEISRRLSQPSLLAYPIADEKFRTVPKLEYQDEFVCEIPNIRLLGPHGLGVTNDGKIIRDSITQPSRVSYERRAIHQTIARYPILSSRSLIFRRNFSSSHTVELACSLVNGFDNYYHWLIEHLPKIRGVKQFESVTDERPILIIPHDPPEYIIESLNLLGYDSSDWMEWVEPMVDVKRLVVPTYPELTYPNLHWLRQQFHDRIQDFSASNTYERIYVSRKNSKRSVSNEAEILPILSEFGIERVTPEELSIIDQVKMFRDVELVIGPHGAGLTNLIWANNTKVIEIFNDYISNNYYIISEILGHDYIPMEAQSLRPNKRNSDMVVNEEELRDALSHHV